MWMVKWTLSLLFNGFKYLGTTERIHTQKKQSLIIKWNKNIINEVTHEIEAPGGPSFPQNGT